MCGELCGQVPGLGSIQFRNWNCSSIPIPELELKLVELKMELELKTLELDLKTGIEFLQLLPQHLLINQQFPNFSFNRSHNLPCDWLLMQQGCFKFLEHCPPVVWSQKTHGEGTMFPLSRQQSEGLKTRPSLSTARGHQLTDNTSKHFQTCYKINNSIVSCKTVNIYQNSYFIKG